ncbi:MAG: hypothetical protein ABEI06_02055 [Halobacteriaceae archaeon]
MVDESLLLSGDNLPSKYGLFLVSIPGILLLAAIGAFVTQARILPMMAVGLAIIVVLIYIALFRYPPI